MQGAKYRGPRSQQTVIENKTTLCALVELVELLACWLIQQGTLCLAESVNVKRHVVGAWGEGGDRKTIFVEKGPLCCKNDDLRAATELLMIARAPQDFSTIKVTIVIPVDDQISVTTSTPSPTQAMVA